MEDTVFIMLSVISKRVTIVYTVTTFEISYYKPPEDDHQQGPKHVVKKCTLNCAPTFVAYGGFYTY
jgi:hypothetical protein